jgi:putative DNA primase/helicase
MKYDGLLNLATGMSAKTKVWKNKKITWSNLVAKLKEENKTNETYKEFIAASKEDQSKIKDVGGYVGGYLRQGKRSPKNVVHRQLMTLDIDFAHTAFWDDFCMQFSNAAVIHATHKHCEADPRYRLVIPMSREATPDEYVAVSRQIAGILGIDLFDNTTFETNRLMFWPSNPKDVEYYCRFQDGPWVDVDEVLNTYIDWKDTSLWPTAERDLKNVFDISKKQEDPEDKKGIVGAFCRTFGISDAISTFLKEAYVEATEGRYTYTGGSTAAGLILYDDKFAYSHHGTDPCGGKLCNAFDLVRIHLFSHLDSEEGNSSTKSKSFGAMEDFARKNKDVKKTIAGEHLASSKYDFIDPVDSEAEEIEAASEEDINWLVDLETDTRGNYLSTAININTILANDSRLKGVFKQNDFDGKRYVFTSLPWRRVTRPEPVKNVDYSGVRNYIESIYGISGTLKIDDSLALEFEKQSFHPIKEYLSSLKWDQVKRVDSLLVEYFGADDNIYTHEAIRKMLVAAVARIFKPGCKFDLVLTLIGDQGTKKSSFIKKLGKEWFSDTFMTVHGKEALEQIQGAWLIEMAELSGLRKAEVESIKHFISKQEDAFRPAYARTSETFQRQCVFFGTTNKKDFLTDPSGNRRFMPIDVNKNQVVKDVWQDLDAEIDQIWAEAVHLFKKGETLFLSDEAETIAKAEQRNHCEVDDRKGLIEDYLYQPLPENWPTLDIHERRIFLENPEGKGTNQKDYVCMAEIWCECLNKDKENMSRYNTREINDIMKGLEDWEYSKSTKNFPLYGKQKYYARKLY